LYPGVFRLCRFANDLHDVVALTFIFEIRPYKLKGVAESSHGRISHVSVLLFLPSTLHDRGKYGVGVLGEAVLKVDVLHFADETNRGKRSLFLLILSLANILYQSRHELGPFVSGELNGRDGSDELCGLGPGSCIA